MLRGRRIGQLSLKVESYGPQSCGVVIEGLLEPDEQAQGSSAGASGMACGGVNGMGRRLAE
ncbi:MAG TPA: hypothetical protein VGL71_04120 [Urbifossiella sp.]